jgi:hypothetical protein
MELDLYRDPTVNETTFGDLYVNQSYECLTLEDAIREIIGVPVEQWKVQNDTAIPSGTYLITIEDSKRFGPETITINNVPGFTSIRMHGGTDIKDTEGCIIVGDKQDWDKMTISGAKFNHVLERLKGKIRFALNAGEQVVINVINPPLKGV